MEFNKPNVSSHYIIGAIIVDSAKRAGVEEKVKAIQREFFQGSAIKSSNVKSNFERRARVLSALATLDFSILAVVVDKRKLYSPGYSHLGSFYKSLHDRVLTQLIQAFPKLKLCSDRYSDDKFMASFRDYVRRNQPGDLFDNHDFEFVESVNSPLVQVADFVCGSLARHYDAIFTEPNSIEFLKILKPRIQIIDEWPPTYEETIRVLDKETDQFDPIIARRACRAAQHFIERKQKHSDSLVREQVACMKFLLLHFTISGRSYISSRQIIRRLNLLRDRHMNLKYFQLKVIAKLRDQGMLITSSDKGYKLPTCIDDCNLWLDRGLHTMEPLLNRITRFRNALKLASGGELDILADNRYRTIRDFADRCGGE